MSRYIRIITVVIIVNCLILLWSGYLFHSAYADENSDITEAGDWIQIILPALAWTSTFVAGSPDGKRWDREGTAQATKAIGGAIATSTVWKGVASKLRPSGSNRYSFPSGHTTAAFAGAGFIDTRYGHNWGIPALLAASFVGYSRVQANAHFADDTVAGMSVGLMNNWLFVTPQSESSNVAILPMALPDGAGLQLTMTTGGTSTNSDSKTKESTMPQPRFRYNFEFGPAYLGKNEVTSPSASGTTFNLDNFNKDEDPTTTAAVELDLSVSDRNEILMFFAPFEAVDNGFFGNPVSFAGKTYPANTQIQSSWVNYDLRAWWRYNLTPKKRWQFKVGAGLFYQHTEVNLATADGTVASGVQDDVVLPFVHGSVNYTITPKLSLGLKADGIYLSNDSMFDGTVFLNYRITDRWDFTAGYTYYARDIETSELTNHVIYNIPYLAVAFSWL